MKQKTLVSHDGITLNYAVSDSHKEKPWIALVIPFGLKLQMAEHFFDFFEPQYNIVVWESRSILEDSDRKVIDNEFAIENHVLDLHTILDNCRSKKFILVGYCSGAGIALAAANRYPEMFENLILAHGEYTMLEDANCKTQFASEIDSLLSLAGKDEEHLNLVFTKIKDDRFEDSVNRPDGIDLAFSELAYLRRYAANYLCYKSVDYQNLAKYVPHRTLILTGERDVQANAVSSKKIAELIQHSEIHIDIDADHYEILRQDSTIMVMIWNYLYQQRDCHA